MALEYKAVLKVIKTICVATHSLVMSPYSRDVLLHLVYNFNGCYSGLTYERLVFR